MFRKKRRKIISAILLVAFVLTIPTTSFAGTEMSKPSEITVVKQISDDGKVEYKKQRGISLFSNTGNDVMTAVWDNDSNLYKVENVDNLYLAIESDNQYFPLEKNNIVDEVALESLADEYQLTEVQVSDIQSIMENYPNANIELYTPAATGLNTYYYGTYQNANYRFIVCKAEDYGDSYLIATGPDISALMQNVVVTAVGLAGTAANVGITFTAAMLGFFGVDFSYQFGSNDKCWATKNEDAYFQYLDFYELGTTYITRGMNGYGDLSIQTVTKYMIFDETDGVFKPAEEDMVGLSRSGAYGEELTASGLAAKAYGYFEDYLSSGVIRYEKYATSFRVGLFDSIPAASPQRYYP